MKVRWAAMVGHICLVSLRAPKNVSRKFLENSWNILENLGCFLSLYKKQTQQA